MLPLSLPPLGLPPQLLHHRLQAPYQLSLLREVAHHLRLDALDLDARGRLFELEEERARMLDGVEGLDAVIWEGREEVLKRLLLLRAEVCGSSLAGRGQGEDRGGEAGEGAGEGDVGGLVAEGELLVGNGCAMASGERVGGG